MSGTSREAMKMAGPSARRERLPGSATVNFIYMLGPRCRATRSAFDLRPHALDANDFEDTSRIPEPAAQPTEPTEQSP